MSRGIARANRIGLGLVGLALVLAGAAALARGLDLWPGVFGSASATVTGEPTRDFVAGQGWFWPVLALGLLVVALLALWWLAAQTRSDALDRLRLETDSRRGTTSLPARVAAGAFADDLGGSGQLRRVNATLRGNPVRPSLSVSARMEAAADPGELRHQVGEALDRHRRALELEALDTTVVLR